MTSSSALLVLFALSATAGGLTRYEAVEPHMGTLVRIQVYATGEEQARRAFQAAFARIAELDEKLSDYNPASELNRLPRPVSADLFRVLAAAQRLAEATDGAFDVTVGPLTRLWREARRTGRVPDAGAIAEARSHVGYRKLHLDAATRTVTLDDPAMRLDLGAIGKGYAADEALAAAAAAGCPRALVAVSGDLAIGDAPPGRRGWRVEAGGRVRELARCAVSTSGDAEQHLDAAGRRYSHIVDPATGMGLTRPGALTVIAKRGIDADSLATAAGILGPERRRALVASYGSTLLEP
jgi:thiamine biosynthesis lipoprotein